MNSEMPQDVIDIVRIAHLVFFALGMGSGLFFDWRALCRFNQPFGQDDIARFREAHKFVAGALVGLWLTGATLIYIRTGFVLSEFSPKLWVKLIVVTTLTVNAFAIGRLVLPRIAESVGKRVPDLPLRTVLAMTFTTALSVFCWLGGIVLGISVTLKTADWMTLGAFFFGEFLVVVMGAMVFIAATHAFVKRINR